MTQSAQIETVKPKSREVLKKLGFIALSVGVCLMLWVGLQHARALQSSKWPKTAGHITFSRQTHGHQFSVNYSYEVNEKPFSKDVVAFRAGPNADANDVAKYPPQKDVDVYYNPINPSDSCLEPGISVGPINYDGFATGFAFFWIMVGCWFFVWSAIWRRLRAPRSPKKKAQEAPPAVPRATAVVQSVESAATPVAEADQKLAPVEAPTKTEEPTAPMAAAAQVEAEEPSSPAAPPQAQAEEPSSPAAVPQAQAEEPSSPAAPPQAQERLS